MSCMRGQVCREALVQVVNSQHIVCQPAVIKVRNQCDQFLDCETIFLFFVSVIMSVCVALAIERK